MDNIPDKPQTIEDLVRRLQKGGYPVKRARRRSKAKLKADAAGYTPRRAETQAAFWATPSGQWKHLCKTYRSRAKARGEENKWKLSLSEWNLIWQTAGTTMMPDGSEVSYLTLRGRSNDSVKLCRIDEEKDWTLYNVVVMYKGQVVLNGRLLSEKRAGKLS